LPVGRTRSFWREPFVSFKVSWNAAKENP